MVAIEVVDLLLQLSRGLLAELDRDQLTPAQWIALRYFSRANSFSRTLSGLAKYQATTAGTASQTIKSLEQSGFLERDTSARDARSSIFTLTDAGRLMVEQDPLTPLSQEVGAMGPFGVAKPPRSVAKLRGKCRRATNSPSIRNMSRLRIAHNQASQRGTRHTQPLQSPEFAHRRYRSRSAVQDLSAAAANTTDCLAL